MEGKDYLGMRTREPEDKVDHGIKGQRWGIRRPDALIAKATQKRAASGDKVTLTAKAKKALGRGEKTKEEATKAKPEAPTSKPAESKVPGIGEGAPERYARLEAQAKAGKASEMNEADLKFFNARTEALSKVAKLNETKPGWLAETAKTVVQTAAKRQLQAVADATADKYIGDKVKASLKDNSKAIAAESKTAIDYIATHRATTKK